MLSTLMNGPLVWIDCEMTGLDTVNDVVIEICVLLTNDKFELLDDGFERVIHCPESRLEQMTEWPYNQHKRSGLWDKCVASTHTLEQVQADLLEYLSRIPKGIGVLAGNSVHMDKIFLMKDMPLVIDWLHYRIVDVSSFKEVYKRVVPGGGVPPKQEAHTARSDILESITELKWYISNWINKE